MSYCNRPVIDVTAAVFLQNGKALSFRRKPGKSSAGYWEFPGGKLEGDETLVSCLSREIREELGLRITAGEYLGVSTHSHDSKQIRLHGFIVTRWFGEFRLSDHDQMIWLGAEDIDSVQWLPADLLFVERVKPHLN